MKRVAVVVVCVLAACSSKGSRDKAEIEQYANVDMHLHFGELMAAKARMKGLTPELAGLGYPRDVRQHMLQFVVPLLDRVIAAGPTVKPPPAMQELHTQVVAIATQLKQEATDVAKAIEANDAAGYHAAAERFMKTRGDFDTWIKTFDKRMSEHGAAFKELDPAEVTAPEVKPEARSAPQMTVERFLKDPPDWSAEALERGLWHSVEGGAFTHACRTDFATVLVHATQTRTAAVKQPDAVTCKTGARYALCAYEPGKIAWVFAADDDSNADVLVAVLDGVYDWAALEPKLPTEKQGCPRPSDDPK